MPSTTSSSVSAVLASSAVITPSLPTFCIAWAIIWPIVVSPLAEMVPTCAISSLVETFLARACRSFTTSATAKSTPRLRSIGFMPAATDLAPSFTIAWARTVAVVVPSPATVLVLLATSRTIWAPMFSNLSASSNSFATVTPSLVTRGAPKPKQHTIASLHIERGYLASLIASAGADRNHLAFLGLLLGGVWDDDAALRLLLRLDTADDHAVMQGTELHRCLLSWFRGIPVFVTPCRRLPTPALRYVSPCSLLR